MVGDAAAVGDTREALCRLWPALRLQPSLREQAEQLCDTMRCGGPPTASDAPHWAGHGEALALAPQDGELSRLEHVQREPLEVMRHSRHWHGVVNRMQFSGVAAEDPAPGPELADDEVISDIYSRG